MITALVIEQSQLRYFKFLPPETLLYFIVLFIDIYAFIPIEFYAFNTWQNTFPAVVGRQDSPTIKSFVFLHSSIYWDFNFS